MSVSSSNLVRLAFIEETVYGETPVAGNFKTARFTSESFSGSPNTTESKQIRTDRMSSGQIVTGLDVKGNMSFELAKEGPLELFMASAMNSDWDVKTSVTVDLSYDAATKRLTRATGSFITDGIKVGDLITPAGFAQSKNNISVMVGEVVSATVLRLIGPSGINAMVTEAGPAGATSYKRADKLTIGVTKKSFSFEKAFLDLANKAIIYRGMIAGSMDLSISFGDLLTGSFGFMGNDYLTVDTAGAKITNARTIDVPATTPTMNGSIDMPFLASSAIGVFDSANFDIKSVSLKLDNNLTSQTVIGNIAPRDYTAGTAKIDTDLSVYLTDSSWSVLGNKLTQTAFSLGFQVKNNGGAYAFFLPAIQVSFDDPTSGGQNQDIMLNMKGSARVGDNGESALVIYRK